MNKKRRKFALALSGGGSRAIAFHLGTLRSLEKNGLLEDVELISSVSGGSVLAALYCKHEGDFQSFEEQVIGMLRKGLVWPSLSKALGTSVGIKSILNWLLIAADRFASILVCRVVGKVFPNLRSLDWANSTYFRRKFSRTIILRDVLDDIFNSAELADLRENKPQLVIVACDLINQSAFYFSKRKIGSWRLGNADDPSFSLATAVAASAAYPALLPPLDCVFRFKKNQISKEKNVLLTDGGVYDNLGMSPIWPGRNSNVSLDFGKYENLIASRAGYGVEKNNVSGFGLSRLKATMYIALNRSENSSVNRIFDLYKYGGFNSVLLPYLGQNDEMLKFLPENYFSQEMVSNFPTNFNAMNDEWICKLSKRGEQVTDALIAEHWGSAMIA